MLYIHYFDFNRERDFMQTILYKTNSVAVTFNLKIFKEYKFKQVDSHIQLLIEVCCGV